MSTIEFCPECGGVLVGSGDDLRCTSCGLTRDEIMDLVDGEEELLEDELAASGLFDDLESGFADLEEEPDTDW